MGLDMYICRCNEENEVLTIIEDFAYFRKFNALHGYFDQKYNLDNPGRVRLDNETIKDICHKLNQISDNPVLAEQLLPTYYGPFFGNYDYKEIYFHHIQEGLEVFKRLLEIDMNTESYYYMADY